MPAPLHDRPVRVNAAFWPQKVTGQQRYAREIIAHLEPEGVPVLRPPDAWSEPSWRAWAWTQGRLPAQAGGGVLVSLTSRAPVAHRRHVVTVHDLVTLTHPEWFSPRYRAVKVPLLKQLLRTAKGVLVVSQPVADQLRARGLVSDRTPIALAPNAAGAAFTPDGADVELPFLAGRTSRSFVLAVGSLEPRKNLTRLIQAHQLLPEELRRECPLVLTGAGSSIFAALSLPEDEHVVRAGFVDDDVLASAYRQASAVVMPSLDEGFGLPVIEALVSGARVLASDIPVFRWVAGDAASYFDPLSPADIARVLETTLRAPADAPRAPLPREFDYADTARTVLELARSLT